MPDRREWTEIADDTICTMRARGETWRMIGVALGLSRNTVIERGRRIGAAGGKMRAAKVLSYAEEMSRGPLPAGHPISWGVLTAGTVLEGVRFAPLSADRECRR